MKNTSELVKKIKAVKFVVFDFDGVFTDNRVIVDGDGRESVICDRSDGLGLAKLKSLGLDMMILSTESNNVVVERARKLNIACRNNCGDKFAALKEEAGKRGVPLENVLFMGNDINDLECLKNAGLPVIVRDSQAEIKKYFRHVTGAAGGKGAVRELCDLIYGIRGK